MISCEPATVPFSGYLAWEQGPLVLPLMVPIFALLDPVNFEANGLGAAQPARDQKSQDGAGRACLRSSLLVE